MYMYYQMIKFLDDIWTFFFLGKPDPPYDMTFVNSTQNSITFSWKPGFNGGLDQEFRIQYQRKGSKSVTTTSIDVDKSADKIVLTIKGKQAGFSHCWFLGLNTYAICAENEGGD